MQHMRVVVVVAQQPHGHDALGRAVVREPGVRVAQDRGAGRVLLREVHQRRGEVARRALDGRAGAGVHQAARIAPEAQRVVIISVD